MADIFDYISWRGDLTFEQDGFNELDALVLSRLSYLPFDGAVSSCLFDEITLEQAAMRVFATDDYEKNLLWKGDVDLLKATAESKRFGKILVSGYVNEVESDVSMQFSAITFEFLKKNYFISYRGTDFSLVGWQEDFNMSFLSAVPAQVKAAEYAGAVARACPRRALRIGGHSKGGNLAAWAAVHLDEKLQRQRLIAAYNNDGPGFSRDLVDTPSYQAVADRLFTYIPASSIVGVLLEHAEDYEVVDSTARSIMQHEPLSWCVEGPRFVHLGQRSQLGQLSDGVLREWIGSMSSREREQFSRAFFDILSRGGRTKTLEDLRSGGLAAGAALIREYAGADEEKKKIISEIFRRLAVDVKDELMKAAGAGVRRAGESILATGQAIADLRK